jgi:hypothetical protein
MNTTQNNNSRFSKRVARPGRSTPENWHVHVTGRRPRPHFDWARSPSQQALLGTIGRPFA